MVVHIDIDYRDNLYLILHNANTLSFNVLFVIFQVKGLNVFPEVTVRGVVEPA